VSPLVSAAQTSRTQLGLTLLRLVIGAAFVVHGSQKLLAIGIPAVTGGFNQWHVPLPAVTAPLVTLLEFFGGLALIVGLLTRLVALGFVIEMLGAIFIVHIRQGFFPPRGFELPLVMCAASAMLMFGGGGLLSVDALLAIRWP
jgi:putative oxidoreductase